ncbi:MAG: D-alanyl-D-alanine carboxypeptidase [Roseburia sp.]|nr:D-alanyl-D-alanine carboxypeptidase [Roseburia sp.]
MKNNKFFKRVISAILGMIFALQVGVPSVNANEYWPEGLNTTSPSAIVMELSTGTILYEKNSQERLYPASITKIMTVMLALENSSLDEMVTFSDAAIDNTEGSGIARDYGEIMSMEDCLYAIMLASANECAYAVAEHVAGDIETFAAMMNEKAKELGCVNTHFVNPHGLHDADHYTCSYDMALIGQAAYKNETFRIITGTKARMIPPTNKHAEETPLQNHNKLLHRYQKGNYVYEYCTGGKTGYTTNANSTLVTFAERDGMALVAVVMNTDNVSEWTDSVSMFNYGFGNFHLVSVAENEMNYSVQEETQDGSIGSADPFVTLSKDAYVILPNTAEFSEVKSTIAYNNQVSDVAGTITYTYANRVVGKADIVATGAQVEEFVFDNQKDGITNEADDTTIRIKPKMIVGILVAIIILVALILAGKYLYDNYYIIRHNLSIRNDRKSRFREIKERKSRRRRRWF